MTKIILSGCCGKMGRVISACASQRDDIEIVAGVDINTDCSLGYPVYEKFEEITEKADVIIDFSHPSVLVSLLTFAKEKQLPVVLATTGFSSSQTETIKSASKEIPLFFTFNMSLGINLLVALSKKAAFVLDGNFDIEIIEKHHNQKIDAPSGTAIMLAEAINNTLDNKMMYEYDRHSKREKRPTNEIGIHSVRGGNIVGEHEVIFAGHDEVITLSHKATSKEVFAVGAIKAAIYMKGKENGIYDMNNIISL
ncbi:MAG: 4-hydroxy-tetrahydrodipicolinate reductase [Ruminococcaceae bacterium]|nr:4-hydroxy-tetrahydrodipicolinate reductase [Oscillospiraceae bacterium]